MTGAEYSLQQHLKKLKDHPDSSVGRVFTFRMGGSNLAATPYQRCKKIILSNSIADAYIKSGCARKIE